MEHSAPCAHLQPDSQGNIQRDSLGIPASPRVPAALPQGTAFLPIPACPACLGRNAPRQPGGRAAGQPNPHGQEAAGRPLEDVHCWRETEAGKSWDAPTLRDPDSVFHATPHPVATPVRVCTEGDREKRGFAVPNKKASHVVQCLPVLQQATQHPPAPSNSVGSPGPFSNPILPSFSLTAFIFTQ